MILIDISSGFRVFALESAFHPVHVVPVGEGVNAFADALRVDVTLADQTLSRLYHSFDPVQVELHGGGEVLVLLYGSFNGFHCGGQFYVSKGRLLEDKHEIHQGDNSKSLRCIFHINIY